MKKKLSGLLLALLLALSLCVPAMAADYGVIYDETESLGSQTLTYQGEDVLPALTRTEGIDLRVDVLTTLSDYASLEEAAAGLYEYYDYGDGDEKEAVTLTILMEPQDDGSYAMPSGGWYVFASLSESRENGREMADTIREAVEPYMAEQAWNGGDMTMSATALTQAVQAMAEVVSSYGDTELPETEDDATSDSTMRYIFDMSDLLSYEEWKELEDRAADISQRHSCGVYFLMVDDFTEAAGTDDVYEAAYHTYHKNQLGMGEDRDGIIVLLSMAERDYAMFVYGDAAEYAFDEYGQAQLEDEFLGYFGDDDWYGGISRYLDACDEYLTKAEAGTPVTGEYSSGSSESEPANPAWTIGIFLVLSWMCAGAVCVGLKRKMRTVYKKAEADAYVTNDGLRLTEEYDRYTHTTKTRTKIEKESSSDGGSISRSGGGGSGRSGKF